MFLLARNVGLNAMARFSVRLLPALTTDEAPRSMEHCELETVPGCPMTTAGKKPAPLSWLRMKVLLLAVYHPPQAPFQFWEAFIWKATVVMWLKPAVSE